jgi:hypothetical protein
MRIQSPLICRLSQQTSFGRFALPILAVAFLGFAAPSAYAHHPIVSSANASCVSGQILINVTVTSWDVGSTQGAGDGENSNVEVFFDENPVAVGSGMFMDPTDSFTLTNLAAPLGVNSVHISAEAVASWGDGYAGGQNSDAFGTSYDLDISSLSGCPTADVRFTGGGKVVVTNATVPANGSVTVTKGFEVECDLDPAHENLELNWSDAAGAHRFHMDMITSAACTLVLPQPNPPAAPGNVINGTGTGSFDGTEGYTVVFTLEDHGEPSTLDKAGFTVCKTDPANPKSCQTSPSIVMSIPDQFVSTGNIQAHVDTGH